MSTHRKIAKQICDYDDQDSVASKLRAKRIGPLLNLIDVTFEKNGFVDILDIGGMEHYWGIIPEQYLIDKNVTITIVNIPGMATYEDHGVFRFVEGDGCNLEQYKDNQFHIVHSNSVIEHVGDWPRMVAYANEVKRLAPCYFVQTPNYWFPVEPHNMTPFFHWLPKPLRVWLVMKRDLGHWKKAENISEAVNRVDSARLLNKKMFAYLFDDAEMITEKFFLLAKSFVVVRQR